MPYSMIIYTIFDTRELPVKRARSRERPDVSAPSNSIVKRKRMRRLRSRRVRKRSPALRRPPRLLPLNKLNRKRRLLPLKSQLLNV